MKSRDKSSSILACLATMVGFGAFLAVMGPAVLDPRNTAWLMDSDDLAMPFLSWWFFHGVSGALITGSNPAYGMEIGSSVYYSDSLPLLALPLKAILPSTSLPIQYHGIWTAVCFMLQSAFSVGIARAAGLDRTSALLVAALACFTPAFLARLGGQPALTDHLSLGGHWLILAALWLNLSRSTTPTWLWPALLAVAAAVHAYLLAMCLALWVASRWRYGRNPVPKELQRHFAWERWAAYGGIAVVLWVAGFFALNPVHSVVAEGYGQYRMNLVAGVDSNGWSLWLPDLPGNVGDHEGFAYLGLGVLFLVPWAVGGLILRPELTFVARRHGPLVAVVLALAALAVTHRIGFAGGDAAVLPVPDALIRIGNTLRASGRLVWPLLYLLLFGMIWTIARAFGPRMALCIVVVALIVQIADLSPGWQSIRRRWDEGESSRWRARLTDARWDILVQRYRAVWVIPPAVRGSGWADVAWFAASRGLATNAVYLARFDSRRLANAQAHAKEVLSGRALDRECLYLLDAASARLIASRRADGDLLLQIDGWWVMAPGAADLSARLVSLGRSPLGAHP